MVKAISTTGVLVVKMKDVAELAGVSSAAVSRYLNGGYISADKAERIKQAIELTGYVRSSQARALRTGSTKLIGVIVPKINSESVSRITAGIGQVLGRRGYQMLLANTDNAADRELEYLDLFQNHPVDGIVLVATMITDEHRRAIESCRVPIVASGLLLGIMSALNFMASNGFVALDTNNFIYKIADLVSGTSFGILQILIGYSAAKAFGANPYLGAVVGGAFINSSLQSAYTVASEGVQTMVTVIPGVYSFEWVGYQGHVIPIVIACAILAFLEKRLHKIVPEMFDLFVTPLVSVFVTVLVTLVAVGPIFVWAENAVLGLIQALLTLPFGIGSFIVGLFYAPTVVTGIHQMYTAIDLGQLAQYGVTYWLPIASAANIAQGGAALAVAFKTRDAKIKGLALPSALSAFMGITEPAIFGVNLRFFKPFIAGCIGGGCGALVCALTSLAASGTGVTGIFGILLCLAQPVQYAIMFAVAALVSFAVSFVLYKDESMTSEQA